jgi:glycosyltransferase involved in cell wall biosynthesis
VLTKLALNTADAFLVLSKVVEDTVKKLYPNVPLFRSTLPVYDCYQSGDVVPRPKQQKRLGLAGKNVILFFGYIREYKGLMNLIEAFPHVKRRFRMPICSSLVNSTRIPRNTTMRSNG